MKVFISADMEGASGITSTKQCSPKETTEYERGRKFLTGDVNAAVRGALAAGANEVLVNDSHGPMTNILIEELQEGARLISGSNKPLLQMQGVDGGFDAAFFVAYHAREGSGVGLLNHTIMGSVVQEIRCNGEAVGETAINAGIAGALDVPVVLLTGDAEVAREARGRIPGIETVTVKDSFDRHASNCIPPAETKGMIEEAAKKALTGSPRVEPLKVDLPVVFEVTFRSTASAGMACLFPSVKPAGDKTVEIIDGDYLAAFKKLWGALVLGRTAMGGALES